MTRVHTHASVLMHVSFPGASLQPEPNPRKRAGGVPNFRTDRRQEFRGLWEPAVTESQDSRCLDHGLGTVPPVLHMYPGSHNRDHERGEPRCRATLDSGYSAGGFQWPDSFRCSCDSPVASSWWWVVVSWPYVPSRPF